MAQALQEISGRQIQLSQVLPQGSKPQGVAAMWFMKRHQGRISVGMVESPGGSTFLVLELISQAAQNTQETSPIQLCRKSSHMLWLTLSKCDDHVVVNGSPHLHHHVIGWHLRHRKRPLTRTPEQLIRD